jgi:hypothetical protein
MLEEISISLCVNEWGRGREEEETQHTHAQVYNPFPPKHMQKKKIKKKKPKIQSTKNLIP